ncbi:hypothetical protein [Roseibium sp.]|uniref:hypothetical protein n=1 Tax=Roseibium sp. TaxID=1936156 RepID=UPI001B2AC405|nr:hypothetical protein [Roseibium sp.]MBO6858483.1 hypothetical protein [Roseibium sp.]
MPYQLQSTFSRGELDPELIYRTDLELFRSSLAECENFITLKRGGLRRRGGTKYIAEVKDSADETWLIPFEFGNGQYYMLEFGDFYFRVYTNAGRVGTVEVTTPYAKTVLSELKFVQSTDILFIAGGGVAPQQLQRISETSWTIADFEPEDGPYLDVNITSTTLTPASTADAIPDMTADNAPSGQVDSDFAGATDRWKIFDRNKESHPNFDSNTSGWVEYQFGSSAAFVVDAYWLQAYIANSNSDATPSEWQVQGSNDGSAWVTLDTRSEQTGWAGSEIRFYEFQNVTAFKWYRLLYSGGPNADNNVFAQWRLHLAVSDQTAFNLTASSTTGINGGDGFKTTDVGRHIRLRASDGRWRWAKIIARTSSTVVTVKLYGHALPDTNPISEWRMGAWSETTGWPTTVGWHKSRLAFAGTDEEPQKVWESQTEDFTNFAVSHVLVASDAVTVGILSGQVNRIQWLVDDDDLVVGTSKAVRSIGKATEQEPYGPENNEQKPETNFGANGITPVQIGSVLLYFGEYGTEMRELAYDLSADGRLSQSVSEVQSHLFRDGMSGVAYQQYPDSVVWGWDINGAAIGFTYERQQQVYGMHRHGFGGVVECMAKLSGSSSDEIWMIVNRTIDGSTVRYIEILQRPFLGGNIEDAWHLDCAALYSGAAAGTVSGLDHLEGEDCIAYADGSDYPVTVTGGEISLPTGKTATKILVGLDVTARAKTLPYPVNAQDGSGSGRKMKIDDCKVAVFETGTLKVGSDNTYLDETIFPAAGDPTSAPAPLKTGILDRAVETKWEEGGQLTLQASGGRPCTVLAVNFGRDGEP